MPEKIDKLSSGSVRDGQSFNHFAISSKSSAMSEAHI
jgi:hypothetical protein